MKKITLYSIAAFLTIAAHAQKITFSGKVVDENHKPISFASITILKDTNIVANKISAEDGSFTILLNNIGTYMMKVEHVSYSDYTKELSFTKEIYANGSLDTQTIVLAKEAAQLNEVVVTARKPFITRKIDRVVVNVGNSPLSGGKSSLELMNLAPSVFVNGDGNISINGNSGTRVMVNGKLLQLSGQDLTNYLSNLRAEDIESLEVIAHPPAQYDAEGTGGLINIVLKKNRKAGFNGSVNANYIQGKYAGTSDGVSLNYNSGKLTLFGNYSYDKLKSFENSTTVRPLNPGQYVDNTIRINHDEGNQVRIGGTYDIDKNQYLGIEYNGSFHNHNHTYNAITDITYPQQNNDQTVIGVAPLSANSAYNNISINYHLNTDSKGSEFVILSDYTHNTFKVSSSNYSEFYDYQNNFLSDTSFGNITPSVAKIFTADIHYKGVLSKITSLSFGGKISNTNIDNSAQNYYVENSVTNENAAQDFEYVYHENIYAGYINLNTTVLNTEMQLGFRGEYTRLVGTLTQINNDRQNPNDYFNLFPSLFLKRNLNKTGSDYLTFNYSRRVERPSFQDLNPFRFYVNAFMLAEGNPYLVPSFINSFELGYTLKNKYTATIFLDQQKNMVSEYFRALPDSVLIIDTRENFGNRYNYGINFNIPIKVFTWWQMQNDIGYNYTSIDAQGYQIKKSTYHVKTMQLFDINKNITASINATHYSGSTFGNFVTNSFYRIDIGLQEKFFNNKLLVKASANDLFGLFKFSSTVYYTGGTMYFKSDRQWQTYNLSLIYNFDLGKAFKTRELESSSSDEKSRL